MNSFAKKTIALFLALALTAFLAGCSGKESSSVPETSSSEPASSAASEAEPASSGMELPETYDYSDGLTADGYFEGVAALEFVTLPDYKKMEIPEDVSTVDEDELQAELDRRLSSFGTVEHSTEGVVADGDTVNIDYVGSIDGVEFAGGNTQGNGTTVTIGVTSYIDDFLEQLIGHKPGETIDVEVTFPDPYPNNPDLANKDALFVTTINYIEKSVTPELTDSFVAEHWKEGEGWTTAKQAKEAISAELREEAIANYTWSQVQKEAVISEVPESVLNYQIATLLGYYTNVAQQYGMTLKDLLKEALQLESPEELVEQNRSQLTENARSSLINQALCEEMDIRPTDEDLSEYFLRVMMVEDYSQYESTYGRPYLCLLVREDMAKRALSGKK